MLYSDIKRATLGHLNQYSIAGTPIAESYNNQIDYLLRLPLLINEGLVSIRTTVKPDPVVHQLRSGQTVGGMKRYRLPDDFWKMKSGGVSIVRNGKLQKTNDFHLQGKRYILTPADDAGVYTIEYYRYPDLLPADPDDDFDLNEDIEVLHAATYYAAANLVLHDDETVYAYLYNDYESRLSRMSPGIQTEVHPVQDAYSFNTGW